MGKAIHASTIHLFPMSQYFANPCKGFKTTEATTLIDYCVNIKYSDRVTETF